MSSEFYTKEDFYEKMTQHISAVGSEISLLRRDFNTHYQEDKIWKDSAETVIQLGKNIQGFGLVTKWIVGGLLAIASIIGALYTGVEWIRK